LLRSSARRRHARQLAWRSGRIGCAWIQHAASPDPRHHGDTKLPNSVKRGGVAVVNSAVSTVRSKGLVLAAMIFAVSMTFIDQTIVSIAAPTIQQKLGLSASGVQWAINAYLLALAAMFAFGGRLADTVGHRKMVVIGIAMFA